MPRCKPSLLEATLPSRKPSIRTYPRVLDETYLRHWFARWISNLKPGTKGLCGNNLRIRVPELDLEHLSARAVDTTRGGRARRRGATLHAPSASRLALPEDEGARVGAGKRESARGDEERDERSSCHFVFTFFLSFLVYRCLCPRIKKPKMGAWARHDSSYSTRTG